MKCSIEPNKIKEIISAAMVDGIIDPINMVSSEKGITALNSTETIDVVSIVFAQKDLFSKYESSKKEEFTFGTEVLKRLKWGFKKDELTMEAGEESMEIYDGTDELPVSLNEKIDLQIPIPISKTEYGFILDYNLYKELKEKEEDKERPSDWNEKLIFEGYNIYKTDAKNLKFPGTPINYSLTLKDDNLKVTVPGTDTSYKHTVEGEHQTSGDIEIMVDAEDFKNVINNLNGEVYLIFNEDRIFITEQNESLYKTFCLGVKVKI